MNRTIVSVLFLSAIAMSACTPENVPLAGSDNTGGATASGGTTGAGGTTATTTTTASTGGTTTAAGGSVGTGGSSATTTTTSTDPVCDENHLGAKDSLGRTCVKVVTSTTTTVTYEFVKVDMGTGGATGTGGTTVVSYGGNMGTGGSSSLTGTINCNGFVFDKTWIGRPINNGTSSAQWCVNPIFLLTTSDGVSSRGCPNSGTFRVYNEATLGASVSLSKDWTNAPLSANGFCSPWDNVTGTIHMSYSYPGFSSAWAMYPDVAQNPALPADSKQWVEHGPNGFGLTFYVVNGVSFSKATYGGNP